MVFSLNEHPEQFEEWATVGFFGVESGLLLVYYVFFSNHFMKVKPAKVIPDTT
jgi:hypothetical protein